MRNKKILVTGGAGRDGNHVGGQHVDMGEGIIGKSLAEAGRIAQGDADAYWAA